MKILSYILTFVLILISIHVLGTSEVYAAASLSLSNPGTVGQGQTFSVNVNVNTGGEAVNAVQANFSYPADKVDAVSVSTAGSAMSIIAENSAGGGLVRIAGGTPTPGFSGSRFIARVTFRARTSTGAGSFAITSDSAVLRDSDNANILVGKNGTSVSFSATAATAPPIPTTSQGITTASITQQPSSDKQAPTISAVGVSKLGARTATISWVTDEVSTSQVEYGVDQNYGISLSDSKLTTNHVLILSSELITPGVVYHYRVKSTDAAGNQAASLDDIFITPGYMVQINLRDAQGKPLANAKVTLSLQQKTQLTNESGISTFESVAPGKQTAKIEGQGINQTEEIEVKDDPQSALGTKDARAQTFSLIASAKHSQAQNLPLATPISVAVVIVIIVALLMVVKKVRRKSAEPQT